MAKRKVQFAKESYYHIYNRGANRQKIFIEEKDYLFLLKRIRKYLPAHSISIIAYCLMPNHYHFLLRQDRDISIAKFIQILFNSYTKAINTKYGRSGTLFEGVFKSIPVTKKEYLLHVCRYIHRNPIDAETPLVIHLEDWPYSNYPEWIGIRQGKLVDLDFIKSYFPDPKQYIDFVFDYQSLKKMNKETKSFLFDAD